MVAREVVATYPDDALLTVEEAASYLIMHPHSVYDLCSRIEGDPERIPHCRLKGRIRIPFWNLKLHVSALAGVAPPMKREPGVSSRH